MKAGSDENLKNWDCVFLSGGDAIKKEIGEIKGGAYVHELGTKMEEMMVADEKTTLESYLVKLSSPSSL